MFIRNLTILILSFDLKLLALCYLSFSPLKVLFQFSNIFLQIPKSGFPERRIEQNSSFGSGAQRPLHQPAGGQRV
jgi:hypothetical protein